MSPRLAAGSALLAAPAVVLSGVFVALFFGGAGDLFGSLNDFFVALALALLVLPAIALAHVVGAAGGRWFRALTWATVAGLAVAAVGQLLLIARVISLEASFMTGSLGILPVVVWGGAQAYLGIRHGAPLRPAGWAVAAVLVLSVLLTLAWSAGIDAGVWPLAVMLLAALCGYCWFLSRALVQSR